MSESFTVLCVDDEPNILSALERVLRRCGARVLTAPGGDAAIQLLEFEQVDVLLSDMRMPGMDGAQLLAHASERWPGMARLLLTGHADQRDTVRAINAGKVSGYLNKPWDADELVATIERAGELARLMREKQRLESLTQAQNQALEVLNATLELRVEERTAEVEQANERLRRNYMASIKAFANLIELRGGQLIGHGRRVADLGRQLAVALGCSDDLVQRVVVAGLLHDIGLIGLPDTALARPVSTLDADQQAIHKRHAALGEQSLIALDDMQPVATLIRSHHERFDGKGFPDALAGEAIELGARILAVADAWDELLNGAFGAPGLAVNDVRWVMQRGRGTQFDPQVVDALLQLAQAPREATNPALPVAVGWAWLKPGMELAADMRSREGGLLLSTDYVLTAEMIERIGTFARREAMGLKLQIKASSMPVVRSSAA